MPKDASARCLTGRNRKKRRASASFPPYPARKNIVSSVITSEGTTLYPIRDVWTSQLSAASSHKIPVAVTTDAVPIDPKRLTRLHYMCDTLPICQDYAAAPAQEACGEYLHDDLCEQFGGIAITGFPVLKNRILRFFRTHGNQVWSGQSHGENPFPAEKGLFPAPLS